MTRAEIVAWATQRGWVAQPPASDFSIYSETVFVGKPHDSGRVFMVPEGPLAQETLRTIEKQLNAEAATIASGSDNSERANHATQAAVEGRAA